MNKKVVFKTGLVVIFLLIGTAVIPSTGMNDKTEINRSINDGNLSGYVTDSSMNPIENVLVRVYFHETYEEDYSDENGYYHVTNIPTCECLKNCTCSKEGYKTVWVEMGITENTVYNFILYPDEVYPEFEGSNCNNWWNSPVTVSFVYDPEEVAEIWYSYHGWHLYTEPFVVNENEMNKIDYYWINCEGEQSNIATFILNIDQIPPEINLAWEVYKKNSRWYVEFFITAEDSISGMSSCLEVYFDDILQDRIEVWSWSGVEYIIPWLRNFKNTKFSFGCSDNACNYILEEVNGSDINSQSFTYNKYQNHFHFYKFFQIIQYFQHNLFNKKILK
jgi:hypothetical protein